MELQPRQILIFLGTWSSLLLGIVAIVFYFSFVSDVALIALALSLFALSLAVRCYGMLTIKLPESK